MYGIATEGGVPESVTAFARALEPAPFHFFDVARRFPQNVSAAGWHVAHILPVKGRNTQFQEWTKDDLRWRFVRKDEFLALANGLPGRNLPDDVPYSFGFDPGSSLHPRQRVRLVGESPLMPPRVQRERLRAERDDSAVVSYRASRLTFRAAVIDRLEPDQSFRVVTPTGTFEMTREEFERTFPNVVRSTSYRGGGLYNYPQPPRRALAFLVEGEE